MGIYYNNSRALKRKSDLTVIQILRTFLMVNKEFDHTDATQDTELDVFFDCWLVAFGFCLICQLWFNRMFINNSLPVASVILLNHIIPLWFNRCNFAFRSFRL